MESWRIRNSLRLCRTTERSPIRSWRRRTSPTPSLVSLRRKRFASWLRYNYIGKIGSEKGDEEADCIFFFFLISKADCILLGQFSPCGCVEAVDKLSRCCSAWISQLEVYNHNLRSKTETFVLFWQNPGSYASSLLFIPLVRAKNADGKRNTFLRGTTEKRPRKLTTNRKPIIQESEGFLKSLALWGSPTLVVFAMRSLIAKR